MHFHVPVWHFRSGGCWGRCFRGNVALGLGIVGGPGQTRRGAPGLEFAHQRLQPGAGDLHPEHALNLPPQPFHRSVAAFGHKVRPAHAGKPFHLDRHLASGRPAFQHADQLHRIALQQRVSPAPDGFGGDLEALAQRQEFHPGVVEPAQQEFVGRGLRVVRNDLNDLKAIEHQQALARIVLIDGKDRIALVGPQEQLPHRRFGQATVRMGRVIRKARRSGRQREGAGRLR